MLGGNGPSVTFHTPLVSFVIGCLAPTGIQSPENDTSWAFGALTRNVTVRSAFPSGETTFPGPCGGLGSIFKSDSQSRSRAFQEATGRSRGRIPKPCPPRLLTCNSAGTPAL